MCRLSQRDVANSAMPTVLQGWLRSAVKSDLATACGQVLGWVRARIWLSRIRYGAGLLACSLSRPTCEPIPHSEFVGSADRRANRVDAGLSQYYAPQAASRQFRSNFCRGAMSTASLLRLFSVLSCTLAIANGCASNYLRTGRPEPKKTIGSGEKSNSEKVRFVGDLTRPWGTKKVQAEGVSLAVRLAGTGSDPGPTTERNMIMEEMKRRDVDRPDALLASNGTSLCLVRAVLPPGTQKGDRVDIDVRVPARSKSTSLENGWVMQARLKEFAKLNNRLASGHELAICEGDILVDSIIEGTDDPVLQTRGRILGGGIATKSRELGLRLRQDHLSGKTSALIGVAINQRFHIYAHGEKKGVANPKNDSFIELVVHPRYQENLPRYIRVVQAIPVRESAVELSQRLDALQGRLLVPASSSQAAVELEAIGADSIPVLKEGLRSTNPEVRFYAAEALAYLDQAEAAPTLTESIRREPAFRSRGFLALGAMDDMAGLEELAVLLHTPSAETRYAAFRTIHRNSPEDPLVRGEGLSGQFELHEISSDAPPLVHVSKFERSEIVLFGRAFPLAHPIMLFGGPRITVRDTVDGRVKVKRLSGDENGDRQLVVDADLGSVIRAMTQLGGKYTDVVSVISQAKKNGCLACKVAYSALPEDDRVYDRSQQTQASNRDAMREDDDDANSFVVADASSTRAGPARRPAVRRSEDQSSSLAPIVDSVSVASRVDHGELTGGPSVGNRVEEMSNLPVSESDISIVDESELLEGEIFDDRPMGEFGSIHSQPNGGAF